jgi:hypothetical protein
VDENRTAPRRRMLKSGKINFSETGAALDVTSPVGIPDHFTLLIESERIHVPCQVVWRKHSRIGVVFLKN